MRITYFQLKALGKIINLKIGISKPRKTEGVCYLTHKKKVRT